MFQDGGKKTISTNTISTDTDVPTIWYILISVNIENGLCKITTLLPEGKRNMIRNNTGFLCFPFSNFRYSLTLFSKFFASFPHGTCTLSVSHQYLALDGIYHPIWAAIPNNSTRWKYCLLIDITYNTTGVSPSQLLYSKRLCISFYQQYFFRPQFSTNITLVQIHNMSYSHFSRPYYGNPS